MSQRGQFLLLLRRLICLSLCQKPLHPASNLQLQNPTGGQCPRGLSQQGLNQQQLTAAHQMALAQQESRQAADVGTIHQKASS